MDRIETIFYFPPSLTFDEYTTKLNNGELADRTIVFADAQSAIYKGGKKYGGWSNQEFHEHMEEYENYDDSWINDEFNKIKQDILDSTDRIDGLNDLITGINNRLNDDINGIGKDIQDKIEDMFDDSDWIEEHFPQGVVDWDEGWNDQIEAYLRLVGYWDIDAYGNKTTKWSKLQQGVDNISASVNNLITDGNISNALQSSIVATVRDNVASLNLGTTYARTQDIGDVHEVIEWLYSGLKSQTDPDKTFAQLVSAASTTGGSNAIADIRTYIEKLKSGDYVAQTEISSKVNDTISTMLLQSSDNNALASLAAKADANSDNISAILLGITGSDSTADIRTSIGTALSGFISESDITAAKSEIYSAIGAKDNSDNFISLAAVKTTADSNAATLDAITNHGNNTSGFITQSNLDDAVAELFAAQGNPNNYDAKASVVAYVKDNKSKLELNADDVNINGYLNGGQASFKGDVQANTFITGQNDETGIAVMSGNFSPANANTNKAYFAYDQQQGAINLWFYQNNTWKSLDLTATSYNASDYYVAENFYVLDPTDTTLDLNPTIVTLYYNRATDKYYTSQANTNEASGTYYQIANWTSRYWDDGDTYSAMLGLRDPHTIGFSSTGSTNFVSDDLASGYALIPNTSAIRRSLTDPTPYALVNVTNQYNQVSGAMSEIFLIGEIKEIVIQNGSVTQNDRRARVGYAIDSITGDTTSITAGTVNPVFLFKRGILSAADAWVVSFSGDYWDLSQTSHSHGVAVYLQTTLSGALTTQLNPYENYHDIGDDNLLTTTDASHTGRFTPTYNILPQHSTAVYTPVPNTNIYE